MDRNATPNELNSLTEQRDRLVIECMCRVIGHTNFEPAEVLHRGKWKTYGDGDAVYVFDGAERFIVGPPRLDRDNDQYVQHVKQLWDKRDPT